ncbi:MAG: hypothetical protein QXD03_05930 [Candidatus Anstonellales archaeon]
MDDWKEIRLDFLNKNVIVVSRTGEKASTFITGESLKLNPDLVYEIPIDCASSLDEHYYFKTVGHLSERLLVLNLRDGFIIVKPLISTVLRNGELIGRLF